MRYCHACQEELDSSSLAAGRCASCGTVIRTIAQRTVEDKKLLHQPPSGESGIKDSSESIDIDVKDTDSGRAGATLEIPAGDTSIETPESKKSDPQRKSPTVSDRTDMTMELPPALADEARAARDSAATIDSGEFDAKQAARDSASTIDSSEFQKPSPRRTHPIESDLTLDLASLPPAERARLESEWGSTLTPGSRQGQTIRQKETITSHRSSLPVKSRFIRERKKDGVPRPPASPAEVPDYELLEVIGEGGMGVVYAAHQSSIARTVAVKMLKPSARVGEEQRDKFISEAVVTGELDHPNIVPIYDLGANDAGALFYSMKRVKGTPWDKVLQQKTLDDNLSILLRVADAVAFAHAHGVVHRDLKPENVMLGDYGEVLVMDWGLARITHTFANADAIFQADSLGGTPAYMAPEMARGPVENINFTSDIYLLGAILYEIIGGKPPHSGRDVMQCLMNAAQNTIDGIRYEGELKSIALRAMATKQDDRYPSVKDFQEGIRTYQAHSESLVLTAHANLNLQKARESGDYQLFARALYGFQESLNLWSLNDRARVLLGETQFDYAKCALAKGDFDLGASLLDEHNPKQADLLAKINVARADRDLRQRRLRRAKQAVAALLAAVVTIISASLYFVNQQRSRAVVAEKEAVEQRDVAVEAKEQEAKQREEAERQKEAAVAAEAEARKQKDIAVREEQRAKVQEKIAVEQKGLAEEAKVAEEYESYVAKIGLAAAKINDNAFGYALELLNQCKPELRNWEWGRLVHLCLLGAGTYQAAGPVDSVVYSPDGRQFASGDLGGQLIVRDVESGEEVFRVKHGQYVHAVAYSPDGKHLATGSSDHQIRIVNAETGQLEKTLKGHTDGVVSVAFSPDGKQLLSGSFDETAILWDLATEAPLQTLKGHSWWVWKARFSPDASRIVTASQDGKVVVWQKARSGEQGAGSLYTKLTEFIGHDGPVYAAAFSPDGKLIATGGYDKFVMVWNPDEVQPVDLAKLIEGQPKPKPNYLRLMGHDGPVRSVAFSPNGQLVASGSDDNAIRLWNIATGEISQVLRNHSGAVHSVAFSPNGKFVLSGGQEKKDNQIRLWNLAGYQEVRVLHATVLAGQDEDAVLSARFSPDGRQIVTASRDRTASLWDVASGNRLRQFEEGHEFLATSAVFFPDGRRLATGAGDNSVRIWDVALGTQLQVLAPTGRLGTLAVSPDGNWIVTGSPGTDAKVWDSHSGTQVGAPLAGHVAEVSAAAFSPGGDTLATGDDRGRIRLWRKSAPGGSWALAHELRGHSRSITALRFTPDGQRLVSSSGDHTCGQWNVATGAEERTLVLKHPEYVTALDLSPDGTLALTACDDGVARLWRLADAELLGEVKSPGKLFSAVSFAPDGRTALVTANLDRKVYRWNLPVAEGVAGSASAAPLESVLDFTKIGGVVWAALYANDGAHLLTIGGNDAALWSVETLRPVMRFSPHGAVASAALSPDGKLLVTGSWDHSAKIWDAATGHAIRKLENGHTGYINTAEFSPDGREILTASDDGTARLWNVATGQPTPISFIGHTNRVLSATFSPDGARVLTTSADKTARIWDRQTGQLQQTLSGHNWAVLCGRFSPDGRLVVTGSQDTTAVVWDAATAKQLVQLPGHTAAVTSVAFSPDSSRVLTGSQDYTVKLWDARTDFERGKEILSLAGHQQEVTSVAFSPDGRLALSSSRDGTAIVWLAVDWHNDVALRTAMSE
jgi:WD40 repeat protein/serine/threonine protein kinase